MDEAPVPPSVQVSINHVRGVAAVLNAIKAGSKQIFSHFACPSMRKFSVQFSALLHTLSVFSSAHAGMEMMYPGPTGELTFEMKDDSVGPVACTYARISSLQMPDMQDLEEYWEEPASYFLTQGAIMKEVIDDLEWPGGNVEVWMQQQPPRLRISARGVGSLQCELPVSELSGFHCTEEDVRNLYKYKTLKAAFCNLPATKEFGAISTKVMMGRNGMLKATHVINLHAPGEQQQRHQGHNAAGDFGSQRGAFDSARKATVHFLVMPLTDL